MVKNKNLDYLWHCTLEWTRRLSTLISNQVPADSKTSKSHANPGLLTIGCWEANRFWVLVRQSWCTVRVPYLKPINFEFCWPFKIIYRNGRDSLNFKKPVFDFSLLYPRKNGIRENQKCVHWILRLSNQD